MYTRRKFSEGMRKALLEIIELNLFLKFGTEAGDLFSRVKEIEDLERLKAIREFIVRARRVEDIENLLK